jgi:hypothetical protein
MTTDIVSAVSAAVAALAAAVVTGFTWTLRRNSTDQLARMRQIEGAYLAGGGDYAKGPTGDFLRTEDGRRVFRVDVANYGKTPAYLTAFDVQFDSLAAVQGGPRRERRIRHEDQIPPGGRSRPIRLEPIPSGTQVVYGAFWYQDIWEHEHEFRFVLTLYDTHSLPDTDVRDEYRFWN